MLKINTLNSYNNLTYNKHYNNKNTISHNNYSDSYDYNTANIAPYYYINKITFRSDTKDSYRNNLRTMIKNNESVMLAIAIRTFTAKDYNGDEKIIISDGEKNGTFISAIERLDELKNDGFNTIHLLPIHPTGKKNALGNAGSLYSPQKMVTDDGELAIDPMLEDKNSNLSLKEQFKTFIDECHKRGIKVMIDLPSCASVDMFESEPELMAFGLNGEDKTPQGWTDIRMFEPWEDETKRTLNPKLLEMHKQYIDACIDFGIDGIRADVARAKPTEFWDILIKYSRKKDPEFAWLAESYTYECASPQVNMPFDRPIDLLRAGFDEYYGQYHIFHEWSTATEFNKNVVLNLKISQKFPKMRSCLGSFVTHDDKSAMIHGGENYLKQLAIIESTIPMCNPYFVDGFQTGDEYDYSYSGENATESFVKPNQDGENILFTHPNQLDIFNLSGQPKGNYPDIERVLKESLNMRKDYKDLFSNPNSSFIPLRKTGDTKDQIIAFARHFNGRTAIVIANKNANMDLSGTIIIPTLKETQKLENLAPAYGEKSEFQVAKNEIRVNLKPLSAYVFEVDTPYFERYSKKRVFKQ